ncbi:PhnD/SsuA/transferrin family substrate-binding protein, partial [Candidatus Giovannonibacteria bacterium]|nr:PhnD/SsuA/transferrin family substrate-binding protein [Candidatus Giovannonibacteria bacterium]
MKKIIILLLIIAAVAAGYFYWLDINKIETIKISSANAENMKLLFAVMQDKGMTDKNKIKLDVVYSDPAEAERKMVDRSNGVEVSVFNPIALAATNQQKRINLRAFVGVHNSYHAILVKKDSTYKKLEDLKGAKIAIRPKVSAAYSAFSVGMQTAGLNLEKDFKLTFGSIPQNVASLKNGEVDATFLNIFETSKLLAAGQYREINDLDQKWFDEMKFPMPFVDFAAHEDWIKENPKKVKRLKMTTLEAL